MVLHDYLMNRSHQREVPSVRMEDMLEEEPTSGSNKKGVKAEIDERLTAGEAPMEIYRDLNERGMLNDKSYVYRRKKDLEEQGAIVE